MARLTSPWTLDSTYTGYDRDSLRGWIRRNGDRYGSVDLQAVDLPDEFRHAWWPEGIDLYPDHGSYIRFKDAVEEHIELDLGAQLITGEGGYGRFKRRLDTSTGRVVHARFTLPEEEWGSGHGKRTMRRSAQLYRALGLSEVSVMAAALGRYVWPNCGFQSEDVGVQVLTVEAIRTFAKALGREVDDASFNQIWEYTDLSYDDDGNPVLVSRGEVEAALDRLRMTWRDCELEPNDQTLLGTALLVWNPGNANDPMPLWPGLLSLEDGNIESAAQLADYTDKCV